MEIKKEENEEKEEKVKKEDFKIKRKRVRGKGTVWNWEWQRKDERREKARSVCTLFSWFTSMDIWKKIHFGSKMCFFPLNILNIIFIYGVKIIFFSFHMVNYCKFIFYQGYFSLELPPSWIVQTRFWVFLASIWGFMSSGLTLCWPLGFVFCHDVGNSLFSDLKKKILPSPHPWYLWMCLYLEIASLQV